MTNGRLKDHTTAKVTAKTKKYCRALQAIARRRHDQQSGMRNIVALSVLFKRHRDERERHIRRTKSISTTQFSFNFNAYTSACCLSHFSLTKLDIEVLLPYFNWNKSSTSCNHYTAPATTVLCIILARLTTPNRLRDLETTFGLHSSQLSEMFWEGLEHLWDRYGHLTSSAIYSAFMRAHASRYARVVEENSNCLDNVVGFIDGTVIGVSRPKINEQQRVLYNGHKRKHALKFQAVTSPDGLLLHACGPKVGVRHDWRMYVESGLEEELPTLLIIDGKQYCLYGDSGYARRLYLEVPFSGAHVTYGQRAFNKAMASVRVTVEWFFKIVKKYWTAVDFKRKMRIGLGPVGLVYSSAMLLTNIRNCLHPNQISQYFSCPPPSLHEYLTHK